MTRYAFIDTETDGLGPNRHIWEVAIITVDNLGEPEQTTRTTHMFLPLDPSHTDGKALAVGGFWDRHPQARQWLDPVRRPGPSVTNVPEAAREILRATHGAVLVGVNPAFDAQGFERILRGNDFSPTWDRRLIDLRAMAIGWLLGRDVAAPDVLSASSDDLSRDCNVAPPREADRHTALGDAKWAHRWYCALTGVSPAVEES